MSNKLIVALLAVFVEVPLSTTWVEVASAAIAGGFLHVCIESAHALRAPAHSLPTRASDTALALPGS